MSDSLREALTNIAAVSACVAVIENPESHVKILSNINSIAVKALKELTETAALSAPQADAAPFGWLGNDGRFFVASGTTKEGFLAQFPEPNTLLKDPMLALYTAPPSQSAEMRKALVLAEDVLSRAPFSTGIWPNGMHPQRGIEIIRKALSRAGDGKESEGGLNRQARNPVGLPDSSGDLASAGGIAGVDVTDHRRQVGSDAPSDPKPADPDAEAEAAIRLEAAQQYLGAIDKLNRATDSEINGPSEPDPKPWPNGCRNPNSCSIHRDCMYVGCTNYNRDISGEVDAAIKREGQ